MHTFPFLGLLPYLLSVAISVIITIYCWQHTTVRGAREYGTVAGVRTLIILVKILLLISLTLEAKVFWNNIWLILTVSANVANLAFAVRYTDTNLRFSRLIFGGLYLVPILLTVLMFFPSISTLMMPEFRLVQGPQGLSDLAFGFSGITLAIIVYLYLLLFLTIGLLILYLIRSQPAFRLQIAIVLTSFVLQIIGGTLNLMNIRFAGLGNTAVLGFTLGNLMVMWGLFQHRLFSLMPVAREALIESMADFVMVTDLDNCLIDANSAVARLVGRPVQSLIGHTLREVFPDQAELVEQFRTVTEISTEIRVPIAGRTQWFDVKITPLQDVQGKVSGRLIVARDITALKEAQIKMTQQRRRLREIVDARTASLRQKVRDLEAAQQALRQSEERFRAVIENQSEFIVRWKPDGTRLFVNEAYCRYFGQSVEDIIGTSFFPLIQDDYKQLVLDKIARFTPENPEETTVHLALKPDGSFAWQEWAEHGIFDADGKLVEVQSVGRDIHDRKVAEDALRVSEERFRLILENMPILLDAFDDQGRITVWNKACEEVTGYSAAEVIGNPNIMEVLYPDPEYRAKVLNASLDPDAVDFTFDLVCKNGEIRTVAWFETYRKLTIPGWTIWGMGLDVTERRRAEDAEREQRAFAEALVDTAATLNQVLDLDTVLDSVLSNVGRAVRHTATNIMLVEGDTARLVRTQGVLHPAVRGEYQISQFPSMKKLIETMTPTFIADTRTFHDWVTLPESEHIRSIIGVPICREDRVIGIINVESDTPNFFKESDVQRLSAFADQVALAIHNAQIYEAERRERILSQMFQRISEMSAAQSDPTEALVPVIEALAELIPQRSASILMIREEALEIVASHGLDEHEQLTFDFQDCPLLYQMLSRGQPVFIMAEDQHPDWACLPGIGFDPAGATAWAAIPLAAWEVTTGLLCVTLSDPHSGREQVIAPLQAFTQRAQLAFQNSRLLAELLDSKGDLREAQSHLLRSAELAIAGEIATGVAHQISNPLTSVMAHTYLLLKKTSEDDPLHEYAEAIRDATDRAARVVQRMLNFARAKEFSMQTVDVNESLRAAVTLVRPQVEPGARLVVDLAADMPPVLGSAEHLEDVWINLMVNASDALRGKTDALIEITSNFNVEANTIIIRVKDNGQGIPTDLQGRIFSSFFTTKEKGVGLGLAIVYDIVTEHRGTIQVESGSDQGTTFVVTLPAADPL